MPLIWEIHFFKDRGITGTMLNDIVGLMSYKKMLKGEYVFEFGDVGDKFYLILDGSVEIQIPD